MAPIRIRSSPRFADQRPGNTRDREYSQHRNNFSASGSLKNGSPMSEFIRPIKSSPGKAGSVMKNTIRQFNPCNPSRNEFRNDTHFRRWHHVFPKMLSPISTTAVTKWKSLCTPACLPLTTDYIPSPEEFAELYQEYTYTVSPNEETSIYQDSSVSPQKRIESLLLELIAQRLAQGYQLIVVNSVDGSQKLTPFSGTGTVNEQYFGSPTVPKNAGSGVATNGLWNEENMWPSYFSTSVPFYLSLGDRVHKLFYDASGQNVEIKRYEKKMKSHSNPTKYSCSIWPRHSKFYHTMEVAFAFPQLENYNWNYLDHLIAGYQEEMTDALKFWRTRFLLIPMEAIPQSNSLLNPENENLDEEELRLAGFYKFIELFDKARWLTPQEKIESDYKKGARLGSNLNIQLTTLNTSSFIINEFSKSLVPDGLSTRRASVAIPTEKLSKSSSFAAITSTMQGLGGIPIGDRRWHFRLYENVFVGKDCVTWLERNLSDIDSRQEACEFGNFLITKGVFQHVTGRHGFLDGHYFYRLNSDYSVPKTRERSGTGWFRSSNKPAHTDLGSSGLNPISQSSQPPDPSIPQPPFELSKRMNVDMDPQKRSPKREIAVLHYDTVHNPKNCYHFELHWLVCTARLIEEVLQSWGRTAEKCGLRLVEAPVEQARAFADDNPFQSVATINLCVPPPLLPPTLSSLSSPSAPDPASTAFWYQSEFLKEFGFVLDVESDFQFENLNVKYSYKKPPYVNTQFVHRSGVAFIQICSNGTDLLWVNNRLLLTSSISSLTVKSGSNAPPNPDVIRTNMEKFCSSSEELQNFWMKASEKYTKLNSYGTIDDNLKTEDGIDNILVENNSPSILPESNAKTKIDDSNVTNSS